MTPQEIQHAIAADPRATARVFAYLDRLGEPRTDNISGGTLAAVCGVDSRTWRRWVGGERTMPISAERLLLEVSGITEGAGR